MGQANKRGTFEERKSKALQKKQKQEAFMNEEAERLDAEIAKMDAQEPLSKLRASYPKLSKVQFLIAVINAGITLPNNSKKETNEKKI